MILRFESRLLVHVLILDIRNIHNVYEPQMKEDTIPCVLYYCWMEVSA